MIKVAILVVSSLLALTGCEVEMPGRVEGKLSEADSKAVGSACRQAKRGLEECFARNPRAIAAYIHEGWLEMDGYVRENGEPDFVGEAQPSLPESGAPAASVPPSGGETAKAHPTSSNIEAKSQTSEPTVRTSRWTPVAAVNQGLAKP